jgi:SAM-dependent methyltransferase
MDLESSRFGAVASVYASHRPAPPAVLAPLLIALAQEERPQLVVDLGSGTGLSSRYWASRCVQVIGIEPSASMRREAERDVADNVAFRAGTAASTGLPAGSASIVTCAQSLHWMDPASTFREAARVLRPGGVFAAFDYDWPPLTGVWQVDAAYEAAAARARQLERDEKLESPRWDKQSHVARMRDSGAFRYVRELSLHHEDQGDAARLIGLFTSQSHVALLQKRGVSAVELGLDVLREVAERELNADPGPWLWSCQVRFGVVGR